MKEVEPLVIKYGNGIHCLATQLAVAKNLNNKEA